MADATIERLIEALSALPDLRQGDIEPTALLYADGRVAVRISSPTAYPGDLGTATREADMCEAVSLVLSHRQKIIEALRRDQDTAN